MITQEIDSRGRWRVNFWYQKIKASVPTFFSQALFLEIRAISSQISSISLKNDVLSIESHCKYLRYENEGEK